MLAPVVVKAGHGLEKRIHKAGISPDSVKGRAPNTDSSTQEIPTMRKPSRAYMARSFGLRKESSSPMMSSSRMVMRKDSTVSSP